MCRDQYNDYIAKCVTMFLVHAQVLFHLKNSIWFQYIGNIERTNLHFVNSEFLRVRNVLSLIVAQE